MIDLTPIKNYILYLKNEVGLSVTLHPMESEEVILPGELMQFNIHDNSYCSFVKGFPAARRHCVEKQRAVLKKSREGAFCGICHAGVCEQVYPIKASGRTVGFVCVGGYRTSEGGTRVLRTAARYGIPQERLQALYAALPAEMPSRALLDTLLTPLLQMLELAYTRTPPSNGEVPSVKRAKEYLHRHRAESITLEDLCRELCYSRSHISHSFKAQTGKSVHEYLTDLRLCDAKALLEHSALSVTEIACSVGFGDSNYFSSVFKKHEGLSPLAYRKKSKG